MEPRDPPAPGFDAQTRLDRIPDVRDGLTRTERVVLLTLAEAQRERRGRNVPTMMLYGRVIDRIDITKSEFDRVLRRLMGRDPPA